MTWINAAALLDDDALPFGGRKMSGTGRQLGQEGLDLFRQFDRLIDKPLFVDLYRDYANTAGFPEFGPLMARLGVLLDGDEIRLIENSDYAEIRATLTERRYTDGSDR